MDVAIRSFKACKVGKPRMGLVCPAHSTDTQFESRSAGVVALLIPFPNHVCFVIRNTGSMKACIWSPTILSRTVKFPAEHFPKHHTCLLIVLSLLPSQLDRYWPLQAVNTPQELQLWRCSDATRPSELFICCPIHPNAAYLTYNFQGIATDMCMYNLMAFNKIKW